MAIPPWCSCTRGLSPPVPRTFPKRIPILGPTDEAKARSLITLATHAMIEHGTTPVCRRSARPAMRFSHAAISASPARVRSTRQGVRVTHTDGRFPRVQAPFRLPEWSIGHRGGRFAGCRSRSSMVAFTRALAIRRPASRSRIVPSSSPARAASSDWVSPRWRRCARSWSATLSATTVGSCPRNAMTSGQCRTEGWDRPSSHPATVSRVTRQPSARVRCDRPRSSRRRRRCSPSVTNEVG